MASILLFAVGAIVPVLPYLVPVSATVAAVVGSGGGLFLLGAATTIINGQSALRTVARQLLMGWTRPPSPTPLGAAIGLTLG